MAIFFSASSKNPVASLASSRRLSHNSRSSAVCCGETGGIAGASAGGEGAGGAAPRCAIESSSRRAFNSRATTASVATKVPQRRRNPTAHRLDCHPSRLSKPHMSIFGAHCGFKSDVARGPLWAIPGPSALHQNRFSFDLLAPLCAARYQRYQLRKFSCQSYGRRCTWSRIIAAAAALWPN